MCFIREKPEAPRNAGPGKWTRREKEQVAERDREFAKAGGFCLPLTIDPEDWEKLPSFQAAEKSLSCSKINNGKEN